MRTIEQHAQALADGRTTSRTLVEECLAHEPDNVQALHLRGNIYRQLGSWTRAAPDLRRVVELAPERFEAR